MDEKEAIEELQMATIKTKNNFYEIKNINSNQPMCNCYQMLTMSMPCRHIFKCRSDLNLPLIEPEMILNAPSSLLTDYDCDACSDTEGVKTISNLNKYKKKENLTVKDKYNIVWSPIYQI